MIPDIIHQQDSCVSTQSSNNYASKHRDNPQLHMFTSAAQTTKKTKCLLRESQEIARFQMRDRITALLITCGASGLKSGPPACLIVNPTWLEAEYRTWWAGRLKSSDHAQNRQQWKCASSARHGYR